MNRGAFTTSSGCDFLKDFSSPANVYSVRYWIQQRTWNNLCNVGATGELRFIAFELMELQPLQAEQHSC